MNLAMIFDDGDVWHFSMNKTVPWPKEKLLKLSKSNKYFGYSDDKGIVYMIHSKIRKPVTRFHKQLNNNGHKIIPKSGLPSNYKGRFDYIKGILLARGFLVLGKPVKLGLFNDSLNLGDYDDWSGSNGQE